MPTNDKARPHPSAKSQVPEVTQRPPLAWPVANPGRAANANPLKDAADDG